MHATRTAEPPRGGTRQVTSMDGTRIAYERQGAGPAVILVGGGAVDRSENAPLAAWLSARFTTYNYDRRGRGGSGDTQPYALEREVEDIAALITEAGGSAHLVGISSGGALALEAAMAGLAIGKLAVYEIPMDIADDWPPRWRAYVERLDALLAHGRRGDAFELFMRLAGSSDADVAGARGSAMWPALEAVAHTLAYDAACLRDGRPEPDRLATVRQPTLVATGVGGRLPGAAAWMRALDAAADAIAASIPDAQRQTIEGATHVIDPQGFGPVLERFLGD